MPRPTDETTSPTLARDFFTDVGGFRVGHWTDMRAATGCTVVLAPRGGALAAVSVLGGAPGTRETDALQPGNSVERVNAVLLTGGSAFGLAAAGGVMRFLEQHGEGFETRGGKVPIVPAAVLYDLAIGDATVRPGEAQGFAACAAARDLDRCEGNVGAGTGATVAKAAGIERGWQGGIASAAEQLADGTVVAALVAVNCFGDVIDPDSGVRLAQPRPDEAGNRPTALEILRSRTVAQPNAFTNTTLVVIATNALLSRDQLLRVADMGHTGIARAIDPSHSPADGDIVFALSGAPATVDATHPPDVMAIGALGARAVSRAIVRAVRAATTIAGVPAIAAAASTLEDAQRGADAVAHE